MECGQGGEVIRLARLVNAICAPPSFVFPHFLNFKIEELDRNEHFTKVWQMPSETSCMYVYIVCVCMCGCACMHVKFVCVCVCVWSVCLSLFCVCVHVFVHTMDNHHHHLLSQAFPPRYFS